MIGFLAGILTTLAYLPQAMRSWKTKKTEDISLPMYCMMATGVSLWIIYGFLLSSVPLVVANGFSLVVILSVLFLKIRYG